MTGIFKKILGKKETKKPSKKKGPVKVEKKKVSQKEESSVKTIDQKGFLSAYRIIERPHITEKAGLLSEENKYVFRVFPKANKSEIKKVIQSLYGVKVEKVHIIHSAPKKRRLGKSQGFRHGLKKGFKKAIVTLKKGEKIELLPR